MPLIVGRNRRPPPRTPEQRRAERQLISARRMLGRAQNAGDVKKIDAAKRQLKVAKAAVKALR